MLLSYFMTLAQYCSFEEPQIFGNDYTDTGDANVPHPLLSNANEPVVNWTTTGGEMGFSSRYEPYDNPDVGLTDGDEVGVTDATTTISNYPDGLKGFVISDVDGNYILEFDPIISYATGPQVSVSYFINETGYEGDGTQNSTGSDRLRIYVKHLEENTEYDLLDTTGSDINDLGIEGQWIEATVALPPFIDSPHTFQLVVEARCNSSAEAFYIDHIFFDLALDIPEKQNQVFGIYPNPVSDTVFLLGTTTSEPCHLSFYDVLGKKIKTLQTVSREISVRDLQSGIYFLKIQQGNSAEIKRFIKP